MFEMEMDEMEESDPLLAEYLELEKVMISDDDTERLPILSQVNGGPVVTETEVYGRRWYVLFVFCLGSVSQAFVWNTYGPITESAEVIFDWEDVQIGMLGNYGNIAYMVAVLPMCYFMDVKGLRLSLLMCSFLIMFGTVSRCFSLDPVPATWLANICAVLNGVGGTVPFAGSSAISSVWFPSDQRATATAIVSFCNYIGFALSFILENGLVLFQDRILSQVRSTEIQAQPEI